MTEAKTMKKKTAVKGVKMFNESPSKIFKRIISYLKPYKKLVIFALVCMLLQVTCNVLGTYLISIVVDDYILPLAYKAGFINDVKYAAAAQTVTIEGFGTIVGVMAAVYVSAALFMYLFNFIIVQVETKVLRNIRNEMFVKIQKLPIKYFDTHSHGEIMSRFTNDTDTLREFMSMSLPTIISNSLTVIAIFVMMMILSPLLTLILVAMLVLMIFVIKFLGGRSGKNFVLQQKNIGTMNGYIEEHIDGMKVVKVFCHEEAEKRDFDVCNKSLCDASKKAHGYANMIMPAIGNLAYVNYAITAVVGTLFVISGFGNMMWGGLISFLQYSRQFTNPLGQMAQQINGILMAFAGAERIFEIIDQQPEQDSGYVTLVNASENENGDIIESDVYTGEWAWKHFHKAENTTTYKKWRGEVEFEDVSFGYVPQKTVLKNINLEAKPGQKVALVGSTGAGKTTITNLLTRFYDIENGKIRYDGINIQKIKKPDLRHSLAMVLQDTHLFSGSVKDNIRFGKLDATDDEVFAAAKLANADYFISHLPNGYDTVLSGDGANLSQGQRQLIAIARAAVANPPVLILDEATSSIDTRTEQLIEQGMDKLMEGRTVFVIAHRLSTVRNSDLILVIENGEIIERGNHEQLIAEKGRYFKLYTGAFELE